MCSEGEPLILQKQWSRPFRRNHAHRRTWKSLGVARDDGFTVCSLSGCRRNSVLDVGPTKAKCSADHFTVNSRHVQHMKNVIDRTSRRGHPSCITNEIVNRRDAMCGQPPLQMTALYRRPDKATGVRVRLAIHQDVEDNVNVEKNPLHRYLRSRYRL